MALDIAVRATELAGMRMMLTLDEDVASGLIAVVRRSGRSFEQVLNDFLRQGLDSRGLERARQAPFTIQARDLGALRADLSLDNIGDLLDSAEGPTHR